MCFLNRCMNVVVLMVCVWAKMSHVLVPVKMLKDDLNPYLRLLFDWCIFPTCGTFLWIKCLIQLLFLFFAFEHSSWSTPSSGRNHPLHRLHCGLLQHPFNCHAEVFYLLSSNDARSAHTRSFDDVICTAGSSDYGRPKGGEGCFILRAVDSFETTSICCSEKDRKGNCNLFIKKKREIRLQQVLAQRGRLVLMGRVESVDTGFVPACLLHVAHMQACVRA